MQTLKQKHFVAVGQLITDIRKRHPDQQALLDEVTDVFANYFAKENPRFKKELFCKSCGKSNPN